MYYKGTILLQNEVPVAYLSICPNGASTIREELGHVIVANELPQAGFQVQVAVEAQGVEASDCWAVLIGNGLSNHIGILGSIS